MVLQLPYVSFPEDEVHNEMGALAHYAGYFHSNKLRWSFATLYGSDTDKWYQQTASLPAEDMVREAREKGFAGIYIDRRGYDNNFTIYDADDQKTVMKDICKRLEINTKMYKEKTFLNAISAAKDELISPEEFTLRAAGDYAKQKQAQVYREYQQVLKKNLLR